MNIYKNKYIKYKNKYLVLKYGGMNFFKQIFMKTPPLELKDIFDEKKTIIEFNKSAENYIFDKIIMRGNINIYDAKSKSHIVTYNYSRKLGEGGYGKVYEFKLSRKFKSKSNVPFIAFKVERKSINTLNEYDVIRKMKNKGLDCDILRLRRCFYSNSAKRKSKFVRSPDDDLHEKKLQYNLYVMQKMEYNLYNWINYVGADTTLKHAEEIISSVRTQMLCLLQVKNDFVYTDLKLRNIGVYFQNGKVKFTLIDIGSVISNNGYYTYTYRCNILKRGVQLSSMKEKWKCIAVQLFYLMNMIILEVYKPPKRMLYRLIFSPSTIYNNSNSILSYIRKLNKLKYRTIERKIYKMDQIKFQEYIRTKVIESQRLWLEVIPKKYKLPSWYSILNEIVEIFEADRKQQEADRKQQEADRKRQEAYRKRQEAYRKRQEEKIKRRKKKKKMLDLYNWDL